METITLPPPHELRQRIGDCEAELKALRWLLRMSRAAQDAKEARGRRPPIPSGQEVAAQ
jgi:hypothetical protein